MVELDIPPPTITAMKIPIIRKGEYDIWSMRIRQYICHTNHNLWDVIVNGDLEEEPAPTRETSAPTAPKTAKQLAAKRNQERVKSILLLAIPDEYLLKFHNVVDAKSLWEAIKSRFEEIDEIDIDDLYNNLRVYEDEMKRSLSSTSTSILLPNELFALKKRGCDQSSSFTSALPQEFEMGESSRKTSVECHEEQIKEIMNHLDELSLDRIDT
ncbi:hypothetical protein Tco_0227647 [Tanacetum coccineum]